jgi:hypothetical protein
MDISSVKSLGSNLNHLFNKQTERFPINLQPNLALFLRLWQSNSAIVLNRGKISSLYYLELL